MFHPTGKSETGYQLYDEEALSVLQQIFVSKVKVFSGMRLVIEYRFSDELMTELEEARNG